ncbi:SIR2 family protein [Massilia agri]|uniref:SIR2 family protein n=1 Tax=Massilia agri TaxID=1886785 RepID=A0ABT2AEW9_9BURK|nr:SIR2 family protein [Massilia agri]MCS0594777.1 SIR2 family protein [Massilia agri]
MDALAHITNLAQDCVGYSPLILLGSGASAGHGIPGMWHLGEHLTNSVLPDGLTDTDKKGWESFLNLLPTTDLESALTNVTLTARMTTHVVTSTWDYLNKYDINVFERVCSDRRYLPLTKLYQHLFRSTNKEVQVVTPNYDRLAEYAAEAGGFTAYTGFSFGYLGSRSPVPGPRVFQGKAQTRTVSVWKVHGSFGWFSDLDGTVISLPPSAIRPTSLTPVIITPGIEKYRLTHEEPFRTTMQQADEAIRSAKAYLCIGYGFNDRHIQTLMVGRCESEDVPLILLTKEISPTAHQFLRAGKCRRYAALEECGNNTKIFCNEFPDGIEVKNASLWKLADFMNLVS